MKVLSLFDGISCAMVALERVGIPVDEYYASEIDKYAIQISQKNYPNICRLGDVRLVTGDLDSALEEGNYVQDIDLLIGGSPCQDLSIAKRNRQGLSGERSGLFWEYVRILREVKPKWFILENVASMPKEAKETITKELGVEPIMINAALVSAQNRKRLFWTNIPNVTQPEDRNIFLKDILENGDSDRLKSYCIDANYWKGSSWEHYKEKGTRQMILLGNIYPNQGQAGRVYSPEGKSQYLSALSGGGGAKTGLYLIPEATKKGYAVAKEGDSVDLSFPNSKTRRGRVGNKAKNIMTGSTIGVIQNSMIRKLTPIECERLQGLPDNYTEGVSNTQRYKMLGNAFNVDVVAHILNFIHNTNGQ